MPDPATEPASLLAEFLSDITQAAEAEIAHPDDECTGKNCTPHGAVRMARALTKLLDGHEPEPLYIPADACGHDGDHDSHFESGSGEMLCGDSPAGFACQWCRENLIDESEADWPCPVYVGAFEALTGEKVPDGQP